MVDVAETMDATPLERQIDRGLADLSLTLAPAQRRQLGQYLLLLHKWNQAYNLTAVRQLEAMVPRHLLDSLAVLPFVTEGPLLDIGSGAGLPGIPIAIALPRLSVTLLDANAKKARFLRQAVLELGLANVSVVQTRVEQYRSERPFAMISSRAFAALPDMVAGSRHLLADGGRWLALKGQVPQAEIAALGPGYRVQVEPLAVPGEPAGARHLLLIEPV